MASFKIQEARFLQELTYDAHLEAQRYMNKGADYALLYFWFILRRGHYQGLLPLDKVAKDCAHYTEKYPAFTDEIVTWFKYYETHYGK